MTRGLLLLAGCVLSFSLDAQAYVIFNGTDNTCVGAFLDSGGQGGSGYSDNEDFTYTICPDIPGDAISVNFITALMATTGNAPIDNMTIYDGDNTGAPVIGNWTGNTLQGQVISASPGNVSGCLTFVWHSNNTGLGIFAGSISCSTPCARPTAVASIVGGAPARICAGEAVNFNGNASFAAPGFSIAQWLWDFDDGATSSTGPVVSHVFNTPGEYVVQLYLEDNNGCASTNLVDLQVLVGTEPTFTGTGGELYGCLGETLCLDGQVNPVTWSATPDVNYGAGVLLPDNVGSCFISELTFTQFAPGQTLNNINDLNAICFDIEHSFLGDLIISIISPSGETVILHQQGGAGTFLGIPDDTDDANPNPGTCWTYCIDPFATNGTMAANAGVTLPAGSYESVDPLTGLLGSSLNGTWTLQICDMWALDNGFLCGFSLDFDPSLFPGLTEFTPVYGNACDSTWWSGPNITSNSSDCDQICVTPPGVGNFNYVYHAVDNFGCTYDTTVTVTIIPGPTVDAGADQTICTPGNVQLSAVVNGMIPPAPCTYTLNLFDTFGDGWDGATVTVTVNGVPTVYGMANGTDVSYTLNVLDGQTLQISYQPSLLFNAEHAYELLDGNGNTVFADTPPMATGVTFNGIVDCAPGNGSIIYTWTPTTGLNNANIANPIASVSGTTVYTVTIYQDGYSGCPATSTVTITVGSTVDAGTPGAITLCSTDAAVSLFAQLGGTPDAGGTWSGPSPVAGGMFNPGSMNAGVYTYTITGTAPCPDATSTVTTTINTPPDPGTNGTLTVCSTNGAVNLFAQLGGTPDAGGTWSAPGGGAFGSTFTPGTDADGVYTYTVNGTAPCPSGTATVTMTTNTPPDPGVDGAITICSTDAAVSLFAQLGGTPDPGGTWSGPSPVAGGMFNPGSMNAGVYTYTVTGTAPCPDATTTVTTTINTPPDPGVNGALTVCSTDGTVNLFAQLGGTPDAGGTWSAPGGGAFGSTFTPGTDADGVYTYTVNGTAPCPSGTATVTMTTNTPPDPGVDGAIALCSTDAAANLFAQLGGTPDAGGTWSGPSPVVGGMFDPSSMNAGAYVYTVTGTAPCPNETATVTTTINIPPDPGLDGSITLCSTDAPANLFAQLGGTPDAGGTWSGPSTVTGGMFDPGSMNAGVYTYTIAGTAPCPDETAAVTVSINTPPDPGVDGSITLCSTDAPASLFTQLGGTPDAGGVWSGPSTVIGGMFDPSSMNAGAYVYTVTGIAPCPNETATVTTTINTPPDPGVDGALTVCSTDGALNLFAELGGTPDAGGTWSAPGGGAFGSTFTPGTDADGVYTYTVIGLAPCPSETATVIMTTNTPPDPGVDGAITLCSTDAAESLFAQLGGTPDAGGTWSGPSAVVGGMINPASMNAGVYTYTVTGNAPCPDETATITVTINTPPDPGVDGAITLCSTDAPASLFGQLGGTPDAGGTWSGPSTVTGGMFDPANMNAGVYTYSVAGTAPCPDETAAVTVTINTPPDPGVDGSITLCSTDAAESLFAQLGGTPGAGGVWSGPSTVIGGMFDPFSMNAGAYVYTVTGTAPCPNETATVTTTINTPPDPGVDGALTVCSIDAAVNLFAQLGGTPDAGGSWSAPGGGAFGSTFTPGTDVDGVYTYTVNGVAPCPSETATVTMTTNTPPDPGVDGAITLCSTDAAVSLFAQLGGTPDVGGTWSGPSPVIGGMFDPSSMNAGAYVYTVTGTAPCPNETATVTVSVNAMPDAGIDGAIALCATSPAVSLIAQLGGSPDPGGTWSGPSPVTGGMFNPANMNAGIYTYTVTGLAPCPTATATVDVNVVTNPDAGSPGSITLCATNAPTDLFSQLGGTPDAGGNWTGPSPVIAGQYDPANMNPGVYTYTITVPLPCVSVNSTVTVAEVQPPDAGIDDALTLCISSPATPLFTSLGGSPDVGGSWTGPNGLAHSGTFNPANDPAGDYTYTVNGTAPCPPASAVVTVSVVALPNAGLSGSITLCTTDGAADLFAQLSGSPDAGGNWTGPSPVIGGQYDPANMNPGVYTYTITVPPPCVSVSSTVTVSEVQPPDAGIDDALTLCISSPTTSLFASLGGSPDAGGSWTGPNGLAHSGTFNPANDPAGVYTYTVNGTAPCPSVSAVVTVSVVALPNAGLPGSITLCTTDGAADLFAQLSGSPDAGGNWTGPSPVVGGQYDPANMNPGVYTYTITVPPPCVSVNSTVTVSEVQPPDAGIDDALTLCISSPATSLFTSLGGSPDAGGSWTGPNGLAHSGTFNPANDPAGVYTYTVNGTAPCPPASAVVTVSVVALPNAGLPGSITLCTTDGVADLFAQLSGSPDAGGNWTGPSPIIAGQYDPANMNPGVYTYTITVPPPCVSVTATVTVALSTPPDAGSDGAITLCISSPVTSLFASLGGSPNAGGTWTDPNGLAHSGSFDPANDATGNYTYTVNGTAPCPMDFAVVTVGVVSLPDPGLPGAITWCTTDPVGDLLAQLGGTPDAGGAWTDPNGDPFTGTFDPSVDAPGTYTYTITVPPPCASVTSTVAVSISMPPDPGTDGSLTLCISSPPEALFASLGGTPDLGGSWIDPNGAAHTGTFDPANDITGDYTYTVNGAAPCPSASAVVTVSVVSLPDPGLPGTITWCSTDPLGDLFAQLGGTPDAGGAWTDPNGDPFGGTFDPSTDAPGTYTYTIAVPPPCVSVTSTVDVAISTPPDPGMDGSLTLCVSSPPAALLASLGGTPDPGGTWTDPNGNAHNGTFTPGVDIAGVYTYTVTGTAPCPNAAASATVTVVNLPDPGTPGALTLCTSDAVTDLFAQLGGTPDAGGSWIDPNGVAHGGTIDPANDPAGVYTYTITVPPPCSSVSATVTISLSIPPDAGTNGALSACATGVPQDLFSLLGGSPDAGGFWVDPNGLAHTGLFDPSNDPAGNYTYTVNGSAPCPAASAVIAVNIVTEPDAGTDAILNLCAAGAPALLFPQLGNADAGGTWTDPNGNPFAGLFDPGADPAGAYTYTVTGTPPCPNDQGVITVVLLTDPDAGIDGSVILCGNAPAADLFPSLSGSPDPGGAWTDPNGVTHSGSFDASVDPAGTYMYLLFVPPPCVSDTSFVTVSVVVPPDAGQDGSITLCSNDGAVQLFNSLSGTPDTGGVWTNTGGTIVSGTFDPAVDPDGTFTYTVAGTTPCLDAAAEVLVTVEPLPDAGMDGSVTVCPEAANVDLFQLLGGTPDAGGSWTNPYGVACPGIFDPGVDPVGAYTYTVFGIIACPNVSASATVNVFLIAPPDAGPDQLSCTLGATLAATGAWASGLWSGPADVVFADPAAANTTFTATNGGPHLLFWSVSTPDGCASLDSVTVVLTTPIVPVTGTSDAVCFGACNGSMQVSATGGNPSTTGYTYQWSNAVAGPTDTMAMNLCAGTYTVTCLDENGCSASATAVINEPPPLVMDVITALPETCPGACDGVIQVNDPEGVYYNINGGALQFNGLFTGLCPGAYLLLMMDEAGCKATDIAMVGSPPPVVAGFGYAPDTIFIDDPSVQFFDASTSNAVHFLWDFAGLGSSTSEYPEFTFPGGEGGTYEVCLTASDANNCPDEICTTIVIYDLLMVHVPNAFTPDGDGINDGFVPIFNLPWVDKYEFLIFDRWGERIFTSTTPGETWDGNYHGVAVESEVYVWELKYRDMLSRDYGKARGHVTVLR